MRNFDTGATRDSDETKYDYEGFISPLVLERFAAYMHKHRVQADGSLRDSDNWQKGIPKEAYMKSMFRHFMDVWKAHRGLDAEDLEESLAALMFNVMGYLYEELRENNSVEASLVSDFLDTGDEDFHPFRRQGIPVGDDPLEPYLANTDYDFFVGDNMSRDHFTHRYGALAHDQVASEQEFGDAPENGYVYRPKAFYIPETIKLNEHVEISTDKEGRTVYTYVPQEPYASVYAVSNLERSEVLELCPVGVESEVDAMASEVRGIEPGQTTVQAGCKW